MLNGAVVWARNVVMAVRSRVFNWVAGDLVWIYTIKGMIPEKRMVHSVEWGEDAEGNLRFSEIYKLDGEVVKQSQHFKLKRGLDAIAEAQQL